MEEMNKNTEAQDREPVIKEFVHKERSQRVDGGEGFLENCRKKVITHKNELCLLGMVLVFLAVILLGIFLCRMPVITVLFVVFLEAVMAGCLCYTPVWLHGAVLLLNIVLGAVFHFLVFLLLACLVYLAGILTLHVWGRN